MYKQKIWKVKKWPLHTTNVSTNMHEPAFHLLHSGNLSKSHSLEWPLSCALQNCPSLTLWCDQLIPKDPFIHQAPMKYKDFANLFRSSISVTHINLLLLEVSTTWDFVMDPYHLDHPLILLLIHLLIFSLNLLLVWTSTYLLVQSSNTHDNLI